MHQFSELVYSSTSFSLSTLDEVESKVMEQLQTSGSTTLVKTLQMIQLQKVIITIGMFSLFDSILQDGLDCKHGFAEAKIILAQSDNNVLCNRFEEYICAINVLKHGKGRSYDALIAKSNSLPLRIKLSEENFFNEGDVMEVSTLIELNNEFVLDCAKVIEEVSEEIRKAHPDLFA